MKSKKDIVIDNGASVIRAGFSGDIAPRVEIPSIIGKPKLHGNLGQVVKDAYFADEALRKSSVLKLSHPVADHDFQDIEKLWEYITISKLRKDLSKHRILMTAPLSFSN